MYKHNILFSVDSVIYLTEEQREEERVKACVQELSTLKAAIEHTTVAGEENEVYSSLKEKVDRESEVRGGGVR